MTTKDQAIARFIEAVKLDRHDWQDWPTDSREAFVALQQPAPDCRTCENHVVSCWAPTPCTNGDQYKPAPHVVLSMIDALDVQAGSIEAVQAANQRLAAERDKLRTQNQALIEAIKGFHTWAYGQRKQQSKGGHASFDYMELREQMDIAEAALAQAEGGYDRRDQIGDRASMGQVLRRLRLALKRMA